MSNIYDSANQIEREIRELQEFKALEEAYAKVKANEEAHRLFKDFQAMQIELQEKQMSGQEFSDEDAMKAQEMAMKIQSEEVINDLMQKEQQFSTIINDLNRIFFKQKTAYEMCPCDWSSDVCSSDLFDGGFTLQMGLAHPHPENLDRKSVV